MKFERYRPETHAEKLTEWFRYKASKPENHEKYGNAIEEAYHDFKDYFGLDRDVMFVFAETDVKALEGRYDEIPASEYAMGFSADPEYHDVERPTVFIMATDRYEYWENILKFTVAHELAHQKFYESRDMGWKIFQRMLFEGHAMNSAEKLSSVKNYEWTKEGWEAEDVYSKELFEELDKFNKWKDQDEVEVSTLFEPGGEKWQGAEGYPVTFQVTRDVLERRNWKVQDLLDVSEEEWRREIEKSIENLYLEEN